MLTRQTHLDSLRGIAALIVIFLHYFAAFYPYTVFGVQDGGQHLNFENIFFFPPFGILISGHVAVCLFFILSGYVLSYRYLGEVNQAGKLIAAIIKRPIRLGGLVWFSIIVGALLWRFNGFSNIQVSELTSSKPWFSSFWQGDFESSTFIFNLIMSPFSSGNIYNPPLWTIKIELYGSIMIYLFLLLFGQFRFRLLLALLLVFILYDSFYQGFWIGLTIAEIVKNHKQVWQFILKPWFYYLVLAMFIYLSSYPNYVGQDFLKGTIYAILPNDIGLDGGYPMLSAFLLFVLVSSSSLLKKYLNLPILRFFGEISYALYITHIFILGSISSWLYIHSYSYFGHNISFLISFLFGLPIIVLLSYLVTKYVDVPFIKLSSYINIKIIELYSLFKLKLLELR